MKILVSRSSAGKIGGAEMSAKDHAIALKNLGNEVTFLSNIESFREELEENGIRFMSSFWPNKDIGLLRQFYYLAVLPIFWIQYLVISLTHKTDLVNPHSKEDSIALTLLKPLHKAKVIWRDPNDLIFHLESNKTILGSMNEKLLRIAVSKADKIFTLNEKAAEKIRKLLGLSVEDSKIDWFASNINFKEYNLDAKPQSKPSGKLVIGMLMRLDGFKGAQFVVEAFKELQEKNDDIELWIVGDGPYKSKLEEQAGSLDSIVFFGRQTDTSKFYKAFDIFVQPALEEGWGRNVKEAKYFGLPIVGRKVGGIAVQIQDGKNGLLFDSIDSQGIAPALKKLIDDKSLRDKLGKQAHKDAVEEGDFQKQFKEDVFKRYQKIVGKS